MGSAYPRYKMSKARFQPQPPLGGNETWQTKLRTKLSKSRDCYQNNNGWRSEIKLSVVFESPESGVDYILHLIQYRSLGDMLAASRRECINGSPVGAIIYQSLYHMKEKDADSLCS